MKMHNPPHPGEIFLGLWLNPMGLSVTKAANALGVSRKTLSKIVNGNSGISPEIAYRLAILGGSPESWMGHQVAYDLWQVEQNKDKLNIVPLPVPALS
jgi:antitoxin HigA-1